MKNGMHSEIVSKEKFEKAQQILNKDMVKKSQVDGSIPFGYKIVDDKIEINECESLPIKEAYDNIANGADLYDELSKLQDSLVELKKEEILNTTNLKKMRVRKRISQQELAEMSGVSIRMIQKYEQGDRDINKSQAITVYKLAEALKCGVGEILEKDV